MRDESEIFKEWFEKNFPGEEFPPDPLEYVYLRETISFQRYLAQEQMRDIVKESELYKAMTWLYDKLERSRNANKRGKHKSNS